MRCPSGKWRYRTQLDARIALFSAQSKGYRRNSGKRTEKSAYPCPDCKGWHLTSRKGKVHNG